jgi:hypothetical protein
VEKGISDVKRIVVIRLQDNKNVDNRGKVGEND